MAEIEELMDKIAEEIDDEDFKQRKKKNKTQKYHCVSCIKYQCFINLFFFVVAIVTFSIAVSNAGHISALNDDIFTLANLMNTTVEEVPTKILDLVLCGNVSIQGILMVGGVVRAQTDYICT